MNYLSNTSFSLLSYLFFLLSLRLFLLYYGKKKIGVRKALNDLVSLRHTQ